MELLWGLAGRPTRGPKPALSTRRIADAAIDIADAEGLSAVSMQRIAGDLAFTKMSLYRYFPGKTELIALMIDTALGEPPAAANLSGDWRAGLREWARRLWDRYQAHPWLLPATVGARAIGPNELGWLESAVAILAPTGLDGSQQLDAVFVVNGHIRNVAQQALAGHSEHELGSTIAVLVRLRDGRFPALAEAIADASGQDNALAVGLDLILDGIERLAARRAD